MIDAPRNNLSSIIIDHKGCVQAAGPTKRSLFGAKIHQDTEGGNSGASLGLFNMPNEANLMVSMSIFVELDCSHNCLHSQNNILMGEMVFLVLPLSPHVPKPYSSRP
jgi:hypothetical protein